MLYRLNKLINNVYNGTLNCVTSAEQQQKCIIVLSSL